LGVIFWCLFAFIASGYEHSVANMTLFSIALLGEHPDTVSLAGMARNLAWVSLGNVVGGSVFMAAGYWVSSPSLWSRERAAQGAEARAVLPEEALPTS
jgi:nitrite transporter